MHDHGVIVGDFLAGLNLTHGHQENLSLPPGIRFARVVHVVLRHEGNFRSRARADGMPLGNLDWQVGALGRQVVFVLDGQDGSAAGNEQFSGGNGFIGEDPKAVTPGIAHCQRWMHP